MRVLCSTEFLWGAELSEAVKLLNKIGCEGLVVSTEPPYYLPSMMHRSSLSSLKSTLESLNTVIAVRSPESDVNLFSYNPYISEASTKSIEDAAKLARIIDADFIIVRPSSRPFNGNPMIAAKKLQAISSRIGRNQYIAFELIGDNSPSIADNLTDPKLGIIYLHEISSPKLVSHRKLVGISIHVEEGRPPRKVIPGLRSEVPYILIYPSKRHMYNTDDLRRLVIKTKNWRDSLV